MLNQSDRILFTHQLIELLFLLPVLATETLITCTCHRFPSPCLVTVTPGPGPVASLARRPSESGDARPGP